MLIDVENRVIILDEAHNIEDSAREAASLSITSEELTEVTNEIEEIRELAVYHVHVVCVTFQDPTSMGEWVRTLPDICT